MSLSHIFLNHNSCCMEQGLLAFSSLYLIFTCSDVQKATNKISKNLFCSSFKFSAPHLLYHLIIFFIILRCLDSALMDLSWRYKKGKGHDAFFIHRSSLCNINYILYSMKILLKPFKIYHINYQCKYLTFLACKTNSWSRTILKEASENSCCFFFFFFYLYFSQLHMWKFMTVRKDVEAYIPIND